MTIAHHETYPLIDDLTRYYSNPVIFEYLTQDDTFRFSILTLSIYAVIQQMEGEK